MLRSYSCRNYKPFRALAQVDLAPLTLVFGHNSSGKSALVRLPRLALRALSGEGRSPLPLAFDGLVFGRSSVDLVHERSTVDSFAIGVTLEHERESLSVDVELQNLFDPETAGDRAIVSRWSAAGAFSAVFVWDRTRQSPPRYGEHGDVNFRGWWPDTDALAPHRDRWRGRFAAVEQNLTHLGPFRAPLDESYVTRRDVPLGLDGAGAPHWLRADRSLEDRVAEWYRTNLGVALSVETTGESFRLVVRPGSAVLNAVELGEGSKQSLPVVTALSAMAGGSWRGRLGIFEQPELHLHDRAQGALADLFVDAALAGAGPLLVETHAEMFLLRVRRRVAEGRLRPDQVAIYWVAAGDGAASTVRRMPVREDGWVEGWQQGVYDDVFQEVAALQRANRARGGARP